MYVVSEYFYYDCICSIKKSTKRMVNITFYVFYLPVFYGNLKWVQWNFCLKITKMGFGYHQFSELKNEIIFLAYNFICPSFIKIKSMLIREWLRCYTMRTKIFYTSVQLHLHENIEKFCVLEKLSRKLQISSVWHKIKCIQTR